MTIDLTGWNPRALPQSKALQGQQVETLKRSNPVAGLAARRARGRSVRRQGWGSPMDEEITSSDFQESYTFSTAKGRNAPTFSVAAKILRTSCRSALSPNSAFLQGIRSFNYRARPAGG